MPVHQSPLYSICVSSVIDVLLHQTKMMMEEDEDCMFDQAGLLPGLRIAIPGPTLLDLQERTNTEQISHLFTGYSVGYLAGSVVGGFLFDGINQSCLSFCLMLAAVATAAIPILAFQEASVGFLDTD